MVKKQTGDSQHFSAVTHAIKNKLASIKALADLLRKKYRKDTTAGAYLKKIDKHIDAIVKELDQAGE